MILSKADATSRRIVVSQIQTLVEAWQIQPKELEDVSREVERMRAAERQSALRQAKQLVAAWDIKEHELTGRMPRGAARLHVVPSLGIKYRHPLTGETWTGEGDQPDWLRKALIQDGYRVEELKPDTDAYAKAAQRAA